MGNPTAILCLGSNICGPWGSPERTLQRALAELHSSSINVVKASHSYHTRAVGNLRQSSYANVVALVRVAVSPVRLLRICKEIEARAGRTRGVRWGPRPLDIDIVDFGGRVLGWRGKGVTARASRSRGRLTIPHPEAHKRAFVLKPLSDILPQWCHPVIGVPVNLLTMKINAQRGDVVRAVDSNAYPCNSASKCRASGGLIASPGLLASRIPE